MAPTLLASMRRKALAGFGLALFLLGINYCLVGAMMPSGAQGMACMTIASAGHPADAASAGRGGHCAGMSDQAPEGDGAASAPSAPCCIALTPVMAPEVGKVAPATMLIVPTMVEEELLVSVPAMPGRLLRAPPGESAVSLLLRAPASSRAPPLA